MESPKRWRSMSRLIAALVMVGWITLSPPPAMAFETCEEFWDAASAYCEDFGWYLCGGFCFEYLDCPLGCDPWENLCCDDGCCQTETFGEIYCCFG